MNIKLLVSHQDARLKLENRISKGKELLSREIINWNGLEAVKNDYYKWDSYNTDLLKQIFDNEKVSEEYSSDIHFAFIGGERILAQEVNEFHDDIKSKLHRLDSILERLELFPTLQTERNETKTIKKNISAKNVFIVHGRDEAAREKVARFLEHLGHNPIILHEQASSGKTVIEKLEYYADVDYAIVLLTPDDVGSLAVEKDSLKFRARQNVVLELGYFLSKLGRSRVCALNKDKVEIPSDYLGVIYINMDDQDGWRFILAKEMKAAGYEIDLNTIM